MTEGPGNGPTLKKPTELIPLAQTTPPLDLTVLFNGFKPLFRALSPADVNKVSIEIIRVLQGEGGTVNQLLAHTASLTNTIANRDRIVGDVINNLDSVLTTVDQRNNGLSQLVLQLQRLVSGLSGDRQHHRHRHRQHRRPRQLDRRLLTDIRPSLKATSPRSTRSPARLATTNGPASGELLDGVLATTAEQGQRHPAHRDLRLVVQLLPVRLPGSRHSTVHGSRQRPVV